MFKWMFEFLKKIHLLMISDLSRSEIERLITVDTREMYSYYLRHMKKPDAKLKSWKRQVIFLRNLLIAFLLMLTPARRLLYVLAIFTFISFISTGNSMHAFYAFVIINFLLALELADKMVARDELAVARNIQLSLLPHLDKPIPGFEVATYSETAKSVGGDYYDFISLGNGSTIAVIGDVSGKGITAALYMVKVQTMLQAFSREVDSPRELAIRLNEQLYFQFRRNFFLTMSVVYLYPDGHIEFCRAGHTPALFYDLKKSKCYWLEPKGVAIGMLPTESRQTVPSVQRTCKSFADTLEVEQRMLQHGDMLLLYTDGVSETFNAQLKEFGEERLLEVLSRYENATPNVVKDILLQELRKFRGPVDLQDDTTFVIIRRNEIK